MGSAALCSAPEDADPAAEPWWLEPCALTLLYEMERRGDGALKGDDKAWYTCAFAYGYQA